MAEDLDRKTEEHLARIRKTIEESNRIVEQANLRIRETDRMLEQQGLTREQVMAMRFSDAQFEAVNAELRRRGMEPLERLDGGEGAGCGGIAEGSYSTRLASEDSAPGDELAERQRKFGMMMKPFHI